MVGPRVQRAGFRRLRTTVAAFAAALMTLPSAPANAREGAPIVFGRHEPPAQASPARTQFVSAAPSAQRAPAASADQPDALYGYGSGRRRAAAPIDLRGAVSSMRPAASLGDDAFDSEEAPAGAPTVQPAVYRQGPAEPVARRVSTRPEWLEQERTGAPYQSNGQWYVPTAEPNYSENGSASWYGADFQGRRTASGELFDSEALTAAHPTLPIPSLVQITNLENGREVIVRVNDRGPFHADRLIDVSRKTAEVLGFERQGAARVNVRYLGPAPKRVVADGAVALASPAAAAEHVAEPAAAPVRAAPDAATPAAGVYFVQVGAFSNPANVERARTLLARTGAVSVDARASLQRVRVGSWQTRAEAEAAREAVAGLGFPGAVVAGGR